MLQNSRLQCSTVSEANSAQSNACTALFLQQSTTAAFSLWQVKYTHYFFLLYKPAGLLFFILLVIYEACLIKSVNEWISPERIGIFSKFLFLQKAVIFLYKSYFMQNLPRRPQFGDIRSNLEVTLLRRSICILYGISPERVGIFSKFLFPQEAVIFLFKSYFMPNLSRRSQFRDIRSNLEVTWQKRLKVVPE